MQIPDKLSAILKARQICQYLNIEDPSDIDIEAIAMEKGAIITYRALKGAEGRLVVRNSTGLITVKESIPELGKKRFVMAHELGHFELHRTKFPFVNCSDDDFSEWLNSKPFEVEANYFAAELLMPENIFKKKIEGKLLSKSLLDSLCKEFQTSLTATSLRFVSLRPEYALVCSEKSRIKWFFINNDGFPCKLHTKGNLHSESIAFRYFKDLGLYNDFSFVPSHAWIDNYQSRDKYKVMEMAIALPAYHQILSFIYVDIEEDDDDEESNYKELDGYLNF
jgi:Zn-dependent peptidase ImmA (M78 family)